MQRTLLILLATHSNEVLSTDRIIDALWDDEPPRAPLRALRYHVSKLRGALGPEDACLVTRSPGYVLELADADLDARRFEQLARKGREELKTHPAEAVRLATEAMQLWRGDALVDVAYHSFGVAEARRLGELRLTVEEDLLAAKLVSGSDELAVHKARSLLEDHPYRERLWHLLMIALYREGSQAEALQAFGAASQTLAEIGLEPSDEMKYLEEQILLRDPALDRTVSACDGNLPLRSSSFLGREEDLSHLAGLLADRRVVTISGTGGIGKTSLAIELARNTAARFADGVWLVQLADVTDPDFVLSEMAAVLGVAPRPGRKVDQVLVDSLRDRSVLIVLDNCEHVLDSCVAVVDTLVRACRGVHVLATSREPLGVRGGVTWPLQPLGLIAVGDEGDSPAVELFLDRAREADPRWKPDLTDRTVIGDICGRLDGIPLAAEMAAARTRSMSPVQILERLTQPEMLTSSVRSAALRHRSMQATLDWSFESLSPDEQTAFTRLAVFRGTFGLAAAERVIADHEIATDRVAGLLDRLVAASLVVPLRGEQSRYRMLEPVRQYSANLDEPLNEVCRRHAEYFCELAEEANTQLSTSAGALWTKRLREDQPNLRAALRWSITHHDPELGLRLARRLSPYWRRHGHDREACRWLLSLLELHPEAPPSAELAESLSAAVAHLLGALRIDEARSLLARQFEVAQALEDPSALAKAHGNQGYVAMMAVDAAAAAEAFAECARLTSGQPGETHLQALDRLAEAHLYLGQTGRVIAIADEIRQQAAASNNAFYLAAADGLEGEAAYWDGDLDRARRPLEAGWIAMHELGPSVSAFWAAEGLALATMAQRDIPASRSIVTELQGILDNLDEDADQAAAQAWMRIIRGRLAHLEGRPDQTILELACALRWLELERHPPSILIAIDDLACAFLNGGHAVLAAELLAASLRLRRELGMGRPAPDQNVIDDALGRLWREMNASEFEDAQVRATDLSLDALTDRATEMAANVLEE